ncbi:adenylate kinase [Xenorhabdus sp. Flor]|uniref:hypothetical protein n=1 Tax=Xenorhabdus cabanillasii TaxID=351673 RepID=UPI0019C583D6|nr:hypothetical protein [Xenorhabdus sp. Flor]MBD2816061.1 adenylate kinase [Xenorhabdus sp. Flor]
MNISIVGVTGSGKSTLASWLAERANLQHFELDSLHWLPNWNNRSTEEFRSLVAKKTSGENWVTCGNYREVRELIWSRSTHIIWLNYSFRVVLWRSLKRAFSRVLFKTEFCNGNTQSARDLFSRNSIILWLFRTYWKRRDEYKEKLVNTDLPLILIEVKHPRDLHSELKKARII